MFQRTVNAMNRFPPPGQRVMVVPFAEGRQFTTSGGGTSWEYFELESLDPIRFYGPWLTSVTAHSKVHAISGNTEWKLVFWWSVDGTRDWNPTPPQDLFTAASTAVSTIHTPYTDRTKFGIHPPVGPLPPVVWPPYTSWTWSAASGHEVMYVLWPSDPGFNGGHHWPNQGRDRFEGLRLAWDFMESHP